MINDVEKVLLSEEQLSQKIADIGLRRTDYGMGNSNGS